MNFPLLLMSFAVGILIGITSMGGAALMAPFLILVLGVRPVTAVGTDLAYGAITKIVGAWVHLRQGTVDLAVVRKLAAGSVPGGLLGSMAVILLPRFTHNAEHYVRTAIGVLLMVVAAILLARLLVRFPEGTGDSRSGRFLYERHGDMGLGGGLLRGGHFGGQRFAIGALPDAAVSIQDLQGGGNGRLPRGHPGIGHGAGARGLRRGGVEPDSGVAGGLDPGRAARQPGGAADSGTAAAGRPGGDIVVDGLPDDLRSRI